MNAKSMRALALSLCLAATAPASASSTLTNFSDLWWTPAESGWGVNVAQQADVMFLTFYVYGPNRLPLWFTALAVDQGPQSDGSTLFAGNLFISNGSYFGGPYDPSAFVTASVGTATFKATSPTSATLTYVASGVTVTKQIERFLLRVDNLAGNYLGGTSDITSNCVPAANNGFRSEESGVFTVAHIGSLMEIRSPGCTYTGSHQQQGQVSRFDGNYTCTNGASGTVSFFDLRIEPGGLSGRYTGRGSACDFSGNVGLARRK
jgi:hypothetical protein